MSALGWAYTRADVRYGTEAAPHGGGGGPKTCTGGHRQGRFRFSRFKSTSRAHAARTSTPQERHAVQQPAPQATASGASGRGRELWRRPTRTNRSVNHQRWGRDGGAIVEAGGSAHRGRGDARHRPAGHVDVSWDTRPRPVPPPPPPERGRCALRAAAQPKVREHTRDVRARSGMGLLSRASKREGSPARSSSVTPQRNQEPANHESEPPAPESDNKQVVRQSLLGRASSSAARDGARAPCLLTARPAVGSPHAPQGRCAGGCSKCARRRSRCTTRRRRR